jgi:hypothetical protein
MPDERYEMINAFLPKNKILSLDHPSVVRLTLQGGLDKEEASQMGFDNLPTYLLRTTSTLDRMILSMNSLLVYNLIE